MPREWCKRLTRFCTRAHKHSRQDSASLIEGRYTRTQLHIFHAMNVCSSDRHKPNVQYQHKSLCITANDCGISHNLSNTFPNRLDYFLSKKQVELAWCLCQFKISSLLTVYKQANVQGKKSWKGNQLGS